MNSKRPLIGKRTQITIENIILFKYYLKRHTYFMCDNSKRLVIYNYYARLSMFNNIPTVPRGHIVTIYVNRASQSRPASGRHFAFFRKRTKLISPPQKNRYSSTRDVLEVYWPQRTKMFSCFNQWSTCGGGRGGTEYPD